MCEGSYLVVTFELKVMIELEMVKLIIFKYIKLLNTLAFLSCSISSSSGRRREYDNHLFRKKGKNVARKVRAPNDLIK